MDGWSFLDVKSTEAVISLLFCLVLEKLLNVLTYNGRPNVMPGMSVCFFFFFFLYIFFKTLHLNLRSLFIIKQAVSLQIACLAL